MQLRSTPFLLALAAGMASAADLRGYFEGNCGGGYLQCGNVGAGVCASPFPLFIPSSPARSTPLLIL